MGRPNPFVLTGSLLAVLALVVASYLAKGGLFIVVQEGDAYQVADILLRMKDGLWPHRDFVTPLGLLNFLPMWAFLRDGVGLGLSILLGQALVAAVLLPAVAYAAWSRFAAPLAYVFAIVTLLFVLALTYGTATSGVAISMSYNRWGWAIAFVVLALALLPPKGRFLPWLDGVIVGLLMAALVMIKITYFVCLAPGVLVALAVSGRKPMVLPALLAGAVAAACVTVALGPEYWFGYLHDLENVVGSVTRVRPGVSLNELVSGPSGIGAVVVGAAAVLVLRRSGREAEALALLLLLPGFVYITYQNFGNVPFWLLAVSGLLVATCPPADVSPGPVGRAGILGLAAAAFVLVVPATYNTLRSPLEHYALNPAEFVPMLPDRPDQSDIHVSRFRSTAPEVKVNIADLSPRWRGLADESGVYGPIGIRGRTIDYCEWSNGSTMYLGEVAYDLAAAGVPEGSQIFMTDNLNALWLFGPFAPLEHGAPWYYKALTGISNADYVVVPKCAFVWATEKAMVAELDASDVPLTLVRETDLYLLFATPQAPRASAIAR